MKPGKYRHFSGDIYEVISVGHSVVGVDTDEYPGEEVVLYRALYVSEKFGPNHHWMRSLDNFQEIVTHNGIQVPRFERVED